MMQFTDIINGITSAAKQKIDLPSGWGQGRALFGGLTAGIAWQHAQHGAAAEQDLRALTISFVAPVQPGAAELHRRILREGKNVTQIAVEIIQEDNVVLSALATYGRSRQSAVTITDMPTASIPPKEQGPAFPNHPLIPEFTHFFDYRVSVGGLPFSGNKSRSFGGWMRFRDEQQPITIGSFLGLVDAWPPALLQHLKEPAPASSLTWTIEFPAPLPACSTHDWWQYEAYIDHAADGYGHTHAHIWDYTGKLVAISRQTVTVFG
ncbi:thioesterase family protein [Pseudidiomarina aestuarii]|uniref:Thioesterase family protein n=1 Tax=Pseudidiomarina aestuarii TaxID=624146 RepID=A0A7Z7ETI2_9GAMM|nr:thioesterase family protein [Pseudidiomarina aestuarii]RUO41050.1 thioesterase family protein [Pseudidiomarina aestuarii]